MADSRVIQAEGMNPIQRIEIGSSSGISAIVNSNSESLSVADFDHSFTYDGLTFYYSAIAEGVANDAHVDLIVHTGAKEIWVLFEGAGGGDFYGYLYENALYGTDGLEVIAVNRNRTSLYTSDVTLIYNPTIADTGDVIISKYFPGGTGGRAVGNLGDQTHEFILKPETAYLARITNKAGVAKTFGMAMNFHENIV